MSEDNEVVWNPNTPNFVEPQWFRDHAGALMFWKGGPIEPGASIDKKNCVVLDYRMVSQLIPFIKGQGLLAGLMENTSREEDIKIIHRLLDIIQKEES